ncbi:uncharacterized protein LOC134281813 [Saccostrea cucullata]|uniref:uncharacterized protein LOC134281813 n=1 Tax=Saccostrea cuccullata TaxID=36930 RepID=UPI002ED24D68
MIKSTVLKFISALYVYVLLYHKGCNGETDCIRKATDLYHKLINNSTCLSISSVNASLSNLETCSPECSIINSAAEDNYVRVQIKYHADIVLKLEHKKNSKCSYSAKDINIDCKIDQNILGSLQSCIIGRCIFEQKEKKQVTETQVCPLIRTASEKYVTLDIYHLIIVMVLGSILEYFSLTEN